MSDFNNVRRAPARLTDSQIRAHLEATSFRGRFVSQSDINRVRRFMEYGARHANRTRRPPTEIPGDYD